jgi:superoxide dismutase, Cu-Zn family
MQRIGVHSRLGDETMNRSLAMSLSAIVALSICAIGAQQSQPKKTTTKLPAKSATTDHSHADHAHADHPLPTKAVCVLKPSKGQDVHGTFVLTDQGGVTEIIGEVSGLTPGKHGFHIHEFGDLRSDDGMSAGGHYNPEGHPHGGPEDAKRHVGDLGNITADQSGKAIIKMKVKGLRVHFVLGRSLVVHAKEDDLKTQPSGDAGGRVGVGVIGIASEKPPAPPTTTPTGAGSKTTKS